MSGANAPLALPGRPRAGAWPRRRAALRRSALPFFVLQGALLMFMVEPMVGRRLVAVHGAGFHVWTTCMMFFSGALFAGYLYAHLLASRIGRWHLLFVASALLWLGVDAIPDPTSGGPVLPVLLSLLQTTAGPFCVLATTSVVAQQWLAGSSDQGSEDPYHLYAASNAGSLLGLLAYPLLVEPFLGLAAQRALWEALLVAYVALAVLLAPRGARRTALPAPVERPVATLAGRRRLRAATYWFLLSLAPSMALLGVTNLIANGMGSIPLVWVAPLAVYLTTFILAFRRRPDRGSFLRQNWPELLALACIGLCGSMAIPLLLFFLVALAAHSELHRDRPEARDLTFYYLVIAAGGWAGAAFVSLAAPTLFSDLYEWPLALLILSATLVLGPWRKRALVPRLVGEARRMRFVGVLALAVSAGIVVSLFDRELEEGFDSITFRNPYGSYRITEQPAGLGEQFDAGGARVRFLVHSGTVHGIQVTDGVERRTPLGYYHPSSPVGDVLGRLDGDRRVAVVGLGAGATAAYFDTGDEVVFYELDPDGEAIARAHFSYLADSAARIRVEVGDARLALARDPLAADGSYDLVFVDAFSGDSIPTHLLTREAIELYLRKLRPDGLLLFHVSSRFYDFNPVLKAAGEALGLHGALTWSSDPLEPLEMAARCYALARDPERIASLLARGWQPDAIVRPATLWTDDYVNVLAPLSSGLREKLAARLPSRLTELGGAE